MCRYSSLPDGIQQFPCRPVQSVHFCPAETHYNTTARPGVHRIHRGNVFILSNTHRFSHDSLFFRAMLLLSRTVGQSADFTWSAAAFTYGGTCAFMSQHVKASVITIKTKRSALGKSVFIIVKFNATRRFSTNVRDVAH